MRNWLPNLVLALIAVVLTGALVAQADELTSTEKLAKARKLVGERNYAEALTIYRELALGDDTSDKDAAEALAQGVAMYRNLGRESELDAFVEGVVAKRAKGWHVLVQAAKAYQRSMPHSGFLVAGEFHRGHHRGGGKWANSEERDRVRALQLMKQAMDLENVDVPQGLQADFHQTLADLLVGARGYRGSSWRLQYKTDLSELPDYDDRGGYAYNTQGAPVDEDGNPVFYHRAKTWDEAKNDGERWRWAMLQVVEYAPGQKDHVTRQWAQFLQNQFGVQTMARYGWFFSRYDGDAQADTGKATEAGTWDLHTLKDNETIARLATGIKRFTLPDEFNHIAILKTLSAAQDMEQLARIYENRRQYPRAAEMWRKTIEKYGKGHHEYRQKALDQLVGNWGHIEPLPHQQAAGGATDFQFRFRNGKKVTFTAWKVKTADLLDDVKTYLKSEPKDLKWENREIGNVGWRIVQENQDRYKGEQVAQWSEDLEPLPMHWDRRITVQTPLQTAGAYLIESKMDDGNRTFVVLWVADTAIVKKQLDKGTWYFFADAKTGEPIAKANVEFFGWNRRYRREGRQAKYDWTFRTFAEFSDADGQVVLTGDKSDGNFQWLVTARTDAGRFAYLGWTGMWTRNWHDRDYNAVKCFVMTDRPVYRPEQTAKIHFWVNRAQYDREGKSPFAGQAHTVQIFDGRNEKVLQKTVTLDEYGGGEVELKLPKGATLGVYRVSVPHGTGTFRVEEYRKPEYEVTVDAPSEPVALGEKISATIEAKYYFGGAVKNATVHYKVMRNFADDTWFPWHPWDWLFGEGFWWFAYDYAWYPGWARWGCPRPHWPWWGWRPTPQPELVSEQEVQIGDDGTVKVEIDTSIAKEIHGARSQRYTISAEVRDASRRTILGRGAVLVAAEPFKVYAWTNRGYYRAGDTIQANFCARRLDGKGVAGDGVLKLMKIDYQSGKPVETAVEEWKLATDEDGKAHQQIKAAEPGQYRLSYVVTDAKDHAMEGGYVFNVWGAGTVANDFRFNAIELQPNAKTYAPGESIKLRINTAQRGSHVLLFLRPSNGVYLQPKLLKLDGRSVEEAIEVAKKDMPNFFIEALTVSNGQVYQEVRQITVPPEKRVLDVAITPSKTTYKPGERATVKVQVRDTSGEPVVGALVLTIYDKAVEYISGGSNVPDIKTFFWDWKRHHNPQRETNLDRAAPYVIRKGDIPMGYAGVFGRSMADESGVITDTEDGGNWARRKDGAVGQALQRPQAEGGRFLAMADRAGEPMPSTAAPMDVATQKPGGPAGGGEQPQMAETTVRTKFADTAYWAGKIVTGKDGTAEVDLTMPENLSTWKAKTWAMSDGTRVGEGSVEVITTKDLLVRAVTPRFLVEKDQVVISAIVMNRLKTAKKARMELVLEGETLEGVGELANISSDSRVIRTVKQVDVPADGEVRVDWRLKAVKEGVAKITVKALTDEESDAMQVEIPVRVHGMLKTESFSGVVRRGQKAGTIELRVPAERRPDQTRLEIRYSPTLAGAMVDALPYLVEYPYGCTEQTLNRFIPTVLTQKAIQRMGVDLKDVQKKITNLNAQEIGDAGKRAADWKRLVGEKRWDGYHWVDRSPVFDEAKVTDMVKFGLERLGSMQCSDGGWGWFSGWGERSYPHTTAVVVHGLLVAKSNDVAVVPGVLSNGVAWLKRYQAEQLRLLINGEQEPKKVPWKLHVDNVDALVYFVLTEAGVDNDGMRKRLYDQRKHLTPYGLSLLGLGLHNVKKTDERDMVIRNLDQYLVTDDENQTAYLKLPANCPWWYWYGSEIETMAFYLKLKAAADPKGDVAAGLVKYLLNNRRHATYWNSTRDTAYVVEAFADFIAASKEDKPDMTVNVVVDGKVVNTQKITAENLFSFNGTVVLEGKELTDGKHTVEVRRTGEGPVYYNAYLTNFTLEDPIEKAGLEIKVERKYFKLVPKDKTIKVAGKRGQVVDQAVEKYERILIPEPRVGVTTDFDPAAPRIESGDLIEVELIFESKNDYEYIVFEDFKAAGCEPKDVRSGYTGNEMGAYVEFRDEKVVFFVRRLARGKHSVSYRMFAETPGRFSALPTKGSAMYAPELKANSNEQKVTIVEEKKPAGKGK